MPLATPATRGAFYRDWRLASFDGTTIDVADTLANAEVFGRAGTGRGDGSAFPQLRIVALGECGTHAVIAAQMDSHAVGEVTLAKKLVPRLQPGMLCLADRGFTAHPLLAAAAASGADLLGRAKGNAVLPVLERHSDGSFRSELVASSDKRHREDVLTVRVIEYTLDDFGRPAAAGTTYRLLTTVLDPMAAPADELAALYAQRWEIESIFDELKTHQRGPRTILRSRTPQGVYQEAWGYLCCTTRCTLIHAAADSGGLDPDRISFTRAAHAARRSVRTGLTGLTGGPGSALRRASTELLHALLPERRLRANARVVRRKMSNHNVKRATHRSWPTPTVPSSAAVRILSPPSVIGTGVRPSFSDLEYPSVVATSPDFCGPGPSSAMALMYASSSSVHRSTRTTKKLSSSFRCTTAGLCACLRR